MPQKALYLDYIKALMPQQRRDAIFDLPNLFGERTIRDFWIIQNSLPSCRGLAYRSWAEPTEDIRSDQSSLKEGDALRR
jgi:hypothetical protein